MIDLEQARTLLERARTTRASAAPTYLDIAGLSHRELVLQRYLEHFLTTDAGHGLDALVADSLVQAATSNEDERAEVEHVLTEVVLDERKRIDIVLVESERVVKVELKIHASLYNDLEVYAAHREHGWPSDELRIVLAPGTGADPHGRGAFRLVTFGQFTARVRANLGTYLATPPDIRSLTFLIDLLDTMERLEQGTNVNQDFLDLLADSDLDAPGFIARVNDANRDLKQACETLRADLDSSERFGEFTWSVYGNSKTWIGASTHAPATMAGVPGRLVLWVAPIGWGMSLEPEKARVGEFQHALEGRAPQRYEFRADGDPRYQWLLDLPASTPNLSVVAQRVAELIEPIVVVPR